MPRLTETTAAVLVAVFTYGLWGVLPVYWKLFGGLPAYEVLAHRVVWSFVFLVLLVLATGRARGLTGEVRQLLGRRRRLLYLLAAAVLVSLNWLTFIWAVNHDLVVECGLGYYICPIFNVLAGVVILRERLSGWQWAAVFLTALGVLVLALHHGSFPAVAFVLASSFALYSLCKKMVGLTAVNGLTLETGLISPAALGFLLYFSHNGQALPPSLSPTFLLLMGAGLITSVPLVMFAYSVNRLPLSTIGLIQYLSPTLTVLLGVLVYGEPFTRAHLVSFGLIWAGLAVFSLAPRLRR